MSTDRRRAAARRRAWGRGPMILRLEPLEGRALLSTASTAALKPDLVGASFSTQANLAWGETFQATGSVLNQGGGTATVPFNVDFYASPTVTLNPATEVYLGQTTVPAGLVAGQAAPIDSIVTMPTVPMAGISTGGTVYVEMVIDPQHAVSEASNASNAAVGVGYNISPVTITPQQPAALVGAGLSVMPTVAKWGGTVTVNDSIANNGSGAAPVTRARVVLTPYGSTVGGLSDFTIGSIQVPAIAPHTIAQVSANVVLPTVPPAAAFVNVTSYTLTVVQDADFVTNQLSPHAATQGPDLDETPIAIAAPANPNASLGHKPDLTPTAISAPTTPITLGQTFQVGATIQNKGKANVGPYTVRFLLVGTNGDVATALFLGDAHLAGLQAGYSQNIAQNITFPSTLPSGLTINPQARIAVQVDPEHDIDLVSRTDNASVSNIVNLSLVQSATPTTPVSTLGITTASSAPNVTPVAVASTTTTTPLTVNNVGSKTKSALKTAQSKLKSDLKLFPHKADQFYRDLIKSL